MASDVERAPSRLDAAIQRLEEHALAVDPKAIEGEFERIWRETEGQGAGASSIRVRVLNLVAVAASDAVSERFEEVMQLLPERHPCRGFLALTSTERDRLEAVISAHCWRAPGARAHVCSEEVLLTGAPSQQRELASAVLSLLVPDVPVVMWLMDEHAGAGALAVRLYDACDAVIFDSATYADTQAAFRFALALREDHELVCHDLAWGRLAAWRALVAQLFDGADGRRELEQVAEVELRAVRGARSSEALLLASWLSTRLQLQLADASVSGDRLEAAFYDGTREVRLRVVAGAAGDGVGEVRIRTRDAEFVIERHAPSGHMHVRENWDSGSTRRIVEEAPRDDASVIERALDGGTSPGRVYEDALRAAMSLAG